MFLRASVCVWWNRFRWNWNCGSAPIHRSHNNSSSHSCRGKNVWSRNYAHPCWMFSFFLYFSVVVLLFVCFSPVVFKSKTNSYTITIIERTTVVATLTTMVTTAENRHTIVVVCTTLCSTSNLLFCVFHFHLHCAHRNLHFRRFLCNFPK